MAIKIPGPDKPETGTLLGNAASVSPEWYNIPKPIGPNWRKWSNMPTVELWEAVALTLNIEPTYNPQGTRPDFDERMEIALCHLQEGGALQVVERNQRPHRSRVRLADVASCVPWELPPEFPKPLTAPANTQPAATSGGDIPGNPPSSFRADSGAEHSKMIATFSPRIGWQVALFDAWPAMRNLYGREPSAAEAIRYLKKNDTSGTILSKGGDKELWWKPNRANAREVQFKTVESCISAWRTSGKLPA